MAYIGFDIETVERAPDLCPSCGEEMEAKQLEGNDKACTKCGTIDLYWNFNNPNWTDHMPFLISCAAKAYIIEDDFGNVLKQKVEFWHGDAPGVMTPPQVGDMTGELYELYKQGHKICAHNGASFDFRDMWAMGKYNDTGLKDFNDKIMELAANSYDLCLYAVADRGWMIGLDAFAKGMEVEGKLKEVKLKDGTTIDDMSGLKAIDMWLDGEVDAVLEYLGEDVFSLCRLMNKLRGQDRIRWYTKRGDLNGMAYKELNVKQCIALPKLRNPLHNKYEMVDWIDPRFLEI